IAAVILFIAAGVFGYFIFPSGSVENFFASPVKNGVNNTKTAASGSDAVVDNEPKTEECPLNGKMYSSTQKAKWSARRPLGVMIENHTEARPQSGLTSADIVYEAVAEGGITRFLSIFYCQNAQMVGPVRSARMYFLKNLQEYGDHPLYAHVGGANTDGPADALGEIETLKWAQYNDLNQFSVPFPVFWRDYERLPNRATEHTVYSSTAKLWDYAKTKRQLTNVDDNGKAWNANFTKWKFQDDKAAATPTASSISFGFWDSFASDYAVKWTYSKTSNSYLRENGGKPHLDNNTQKQLEAKNVVTLFMKESPANDGYEGGHILYKVIGDGDGYLFQNGTVTKINWEKTKETSRMKFTDVSDKEVAFVRGQIFIEILPIGNKVEYQ
ncbi:DUF3048 domain-containing protein, partial [Candidatus Roizmanbacteria bacterium]|nr:DUF3048 domain-containing protein [Candidatus Roizmanbacteria bacterium]